MPHFKTGQTRHGRIIEEVTLTASGAYSVPVGATHLSVEMWGGGGGGALGRGSLSPKRSGGGGGSGAYTYIVLIEDFQKADTVNFTVGTGGAGATDVNNPGSDGTATSLDTYKRSTTTIVTYSNINAGGGGVAGEASSGRNSSGGSGGRSNGGISPSVNGSSGNNGTSNSTCAPGGDGANPSFSNLMVFNGGFCDSFLDIASAGIAGDSKGGGGGGGGASGSSSFSGGNGGSGIAKISAYGYYPPIPTVSGFILGI